jgi:hypothetical protein
MFTMKTWPIFLSLILLGCTSAKTTTGSAPPQLEVQQVARECEIVVHLTDVAPPNPQHVTCSVYRVLEDKSLMKLADVPLTKPKKGEDGLFIGLYCDGKDFPQGTDVVVVYRRARDDVPVRASTKMLYY